ncbi:hypothetical protein GGS20DRAFT_84986 [Poronia punctata]|nr:hypothetical protein GGS20DRAFT_84986 [Poronia punctata]
MASHVDLYVVNEINYLANRGFKDCETNFENLLISHGELITPGAVISSTSFKALFEEHYEPSLTHYVFLTQNLRDIWGEYDVLVSQGQEVEEEEEEALEQLKDTGDMGILALNKFERLLDRIGDLIVDVTPRVGVYENEDYGWLKKKYEDLGERLGDRSGLSGPPNLSSVRQCVENAMVVATSNNNNTKKRKQQQQQHDNDNPITTAKKAKKTPSANWWGPNNSKLASNPRFEMLAKGFKAYLDSPKHEPGTREYKEDLEDMLSQSLGALGLPDDLEVLRLYQQDWDFRDVGSAARAPASINPVLAEDQVRTGWGASFGINEIKQRLGGGLAPDELPRQPGAGAEAVAMSASLNAQRSLSADEKRFRLRGGTAIASEGLHLRDPEKLWEQLLEDSHYPDRVFYERVRSGRPPMVDASRMGKTIGKFKRVIELKPDERLWEKIQTEKKPETLKALADRQLEILKDERESAMAFISECVLLDQPKLNEPNGKNREKFRYGKLRSMDFVRPVANAFAARMTQVCRLAIFHKLYKAGETSLRQLLTEHVTNLDVWDAHESVWLEWENCRWFELRSENELADLEARFFAREKLRQGWQDEKKRIEEVIAVVEAKPGDYTLVDGVVTTVSAVQISSGALETTTKQSLPEVVEIDDDDDDDDDNAMDIDTNTNKLVQKRLELYKDEDKKELGFKRAVAAKVLEFYQQQRGLYATKLREVITKNNYLDPKDRGNQSFLTRNSWDIMAKQQVLWSLDTEIHNMKRSMDPDAENTHGRGATHRWELPESEAFQTYVRFPPPPSKLPLGVTSLSPGPMLGEHPRPAHPRVLVGVGPQFGERSFREEEGQGLAKPASKAIGSGPKPGEKSGVEQRDRDRGGPKPGPESGSEGPQTLKARDQSTPLTKGFSISTAATAAVPTPTPTAHAAHAKVPLQPPSSTKAGADIPLQIDDIPRDWESLMQLHRDTWQQKKPTGTALLSWDDWAEAVYLAALHSTRGIRFVFPSDSPFKGSDEDIRRHIYNLYEDTFPDPYGHNTMYWREREHLRHDILEDLVEEINHALIGQGKTDKLFEAVYPPIQDVGHVNPITKGSANQNEAVERLREANAHIKNLLLLDDKIGREERETLLTHKGYYEALLDEGMRLQASATYEQEKQKRKIQPERQEKEKQQQATTITTTTVQDHTPELATYRKLIADLTKEVQQSGPIAQRMTEGAKRLSGVTRKFGTEQAKREATLAVTEAKQATHRYLTAKNTLEVARAGLDEWTRTGRNPSPSQDMLVRQYESLADYETWKDSRTWPSTTTEEDQHRTWIVEISNLAHNLAKSAGQNNNNNITGPDHWFKMQYLFWDESTGNTLEKRRQSFLYTVAKRFNLANLIPMPPLLPSPKENEEPEEEEQSLTAEEILGKPLSLRRGLPPPPSPTKPSPSSSSPLFGKRPGGSSSSTYSTSPITPLFKKTPLFQKKSIFDNNTNNNKPPPLLHPDSPAPAPKHEPSLSKHNIPPLLSPPFSFSGKSVRFAKTAVAMAAAGSRSHSHSHSHTEDDNKDAWPLLKDEILATTNAIFAHEVLRQRPGTSVGDSSGQHGWPAPVQGDQGMEL